MGVQTVTREALYEQVWSMPMTRLAKTYGISDVGLAKACDRHNIPRPAVGYWARKAHGKRVRQTPLPACDDPKRQTIRIEATGTFSSRKPAQREPVSKITVAERLTTPHPLVAATKRKLDSMTPGPDGLVHSGLSDALVVAVSRNSISRAMRVLDALLKHWESTGGTVRSSALGNGKDEASISLKERTKATDSQARRNRWQDVPRKPTGQLTLSVEGIFGHGLRSNWSDGKRHRLEDLLGSFTGGLIQHLDLLRKRRLDRECQARQNQLAHEARRRRKELRKAEATRQKELLALVRRFEKARQIRELLGHLERKQDWADCSAPTTLPRERWISWARWYADSIDPTVDCGPSPEDTEPKRPEAVRIESLDLTSSTRAVLTRLGVADSDALDRLSEKEIRSEETRWEWGTWGEICRVLEGLGYDVSGRSHWL